MVVNGGLVGGLNNLQNMSSPMEGWHDDIPYIMVN